MAEHNSGEDRTEQATPKRLREAAEKGQVPRSRELTTLAMLLAAAASLLALGAPLAQGLAAQMARGLRQDARHIFDTAAIPAALGHALQDSLLLLAPFLVVMVLVALAAPVALGGWSFSTQSLGFKLERVSPAKGLGRLFSWRALVELLKALGKFLLIGTIAVALLWHKESELMHLGSEPLLPALAHTARLLGWMFLWLALPMLLVAGVDVPFQLFEHSRNLRMTKQEVRDEMKETEGKPEVKSRIRRLQHELAQRRMMEQVPHSDVVVANPNHFAVALKYRRQTMRAPLLVAKGTDLVALRIRAIAAAHRVPIVQSPLLARALYFNGELEKPIPMALYVAVAQVLAYVFQLRREGGLADRPIVMDEVPVPSNMRTE